MASSEAAPGQLDGADEHIGHAPGQILAGRRDPHDVGGSFRGGVEFAGQRQRRAPRRTPVGYRSSPVDLVLDAATAFGERPRPRRRVPSAPAPARHRRPPTRPRPRMRRRGRAPFGVCDCLVELVFEEQGCRCDAVDDAAAARVGDLAAQQLKHLVGAFGVAHRTSAGWRSARFPSAPARARSWCRGRSRLSVSSDFGGLTLPQQRAGQQFAGVQAAAAAAPPRGPAARRG